MDWMSILKIERKNFFSRSKEVDIIFKILTGRCGLNQNILSVFNK